MHINEASITCQIMREKTKKIYSLCAKKRAQHWDRDAVNKRRGRVGLPQKVSKTTLFFSEAGRMVNMSGSFLGRENAGGGEHTEVPIGGEQHSLIQQAQGGHERAKD